MFFVSTVSLGCVVLFEVKFYNFVSLSVLIWFWGLTSLWNSCLIGAVYSHAGSGPGPGPGCDVCHEVEEAITYYFRQPSVLLHDQSLETGALWDLREISLMSFSISEILSASLHFSTEELRPAQPWDAQTSCFPFFFPPTRKLSTKPDRGPSLRWALQRFVDGLWNNNKLCFTLWRLCCLAKAQSKSISLIIQERTTRGKSLSAGDNVEVGFLVLCHLGWLKKLRG